MHSAWMILTEPDRGLHPTNMHNVWVILTEPGHRGLHSSNTHSVWVILTEPGTGVSNLVTYTVRG